MAPTPCGWAEGEHGQGEFPVRKPSDFSWDPEQPAAASTDDGSAAHLPRLRAIGLPGLVDAHTHWFPDNVTRKIWDYFDRHYWPICYREPVPGRLEWMRRNGVERFTVLTYAHRPGMAAWLNECTARLAQDVPQAVPCGTFFPEPDVGAVVRRCIEEYRFHGFKLHCRVGAFDPGQPALEPAFEQVQAAGLPVVLHVGGAPDPGRYTVPAVLRRLVMRYPRLKVVVAHMGANEYEEYLGLAEALPTVYLDTTMVFVGFNACGAYPRAFLPRLEAMSHKVLFGSDFPAIPYSLPYAVQQLLALPLSDQAKRRMLWSNAVGLFRMQDLPENPAPAL
ncbi:MAG TPA: amidohydrolase family protein [bacterium]|nr:amidohydrolase family protein [bacterium]